MHPQELTILESIECRKSGFALICSNAVKIIEIFPNSNIQTFIGFLDFIYFSNSFALVIV
jgi:hypothetical protein